MALSITEVARLTGVTSRTLRHYDAIGLLAPARVGANGYRYYEEAQLLRLQQILLLRELGMGLEAIGEILTGQRDRLEALRGHREWLQAEQQRLARLADTVARTITHLQEGTPMSAPEMFDGFAERQAEAEESLAARYGEGVREHFATARQRTADWTRQDHLAAQQEMERLDSRVLELLRSGAEPGAPEVLDVIDGHHRAVAQHWTPDRASYTGLGQLYVDDPQFRARYDALDPALAEFYRDAIGAYAQQRLS
ncbi:DNA-binding transcriptional MerR regulator [Kineococcus xinjiangensis]|uniref:DNA-binding transcriptional MerR regulator n=1 Tax=Kineococcus xinjiangensis TaxID=512762 RepID=A0A2S6IDP1_9ACTN|nr:MerR family transcriptional regulator [Kineococcus xinjiangensis]PPK92317.1 DNA-binding transcriptional MerR regulator [Kineococcus xinjiangensis]